MPYEGPFPSRYDGFVYLAKSDTGHFKVGRSVKPARRIKHFDTQMPVEVSEWHRFNADNYKDAEKALHDICDEHANHVKGEWWDMPEYLVWWIKDIVYYEDGDFYGGGQTQNEPLEEPSPSYMNYTKHFGKRANRAKSNSIMAARHG